IATAEGSQRLFIFIPDAIKGLDTSRRRVTGFQVLARAKVDHEAIPLLWMRPHLGASRDRLGVASSVFRGEQGDRRTAIHVLYFPIAGIGISDIERPQVTAQIAGDNVLCC